MLEEISNDEELDGRVMARVHDLHSGQQEAENVQHATGQRTSATRQVPLLRSPAYTRRAIVTAGAAIAGCALLGVAVPAGRRLFQGGQTQPAIREGTQENVTPTMPGSTPGDSVHSFGLAVAMANEPDSSGRTSFELASTAEGMLPLASSNALLIYFRMNLTAIGEGIDHLIYRLEDIPTRPNPLLTVNAIQTEVNALFFMKCVRGTVPVGHAREGWSYYAFNKTEENEQPNVTQFEVSHDDHEAGNDGILNGGTYWIVGAYTPDKFWEGDELLKLFGRVWGSVLVINGPAPASSIDPTEAWQAYHERFDGDGDALREWMRSCYASYLTHTANLLAQATLTVDAFFEDGVCATRRYHLETMPEFERTAKERFDALLACSGYEILSNGEIVDKFGTSYERGHQYPPLFDLIDCEPPQDIDDPRLSAPLFTITDVTDEGA